MGIIEKIKNIKLGIPIKKGKLDKYTESEKLLKIIIRLSYFITLINKIIFDSRETEKPIKFRLVLYLFWTILPMIAIHYNSYFNNDEYFIYEYQRRLLNLNVNIVTSFIGDSKGKKYIFIYMTELFFLRRMKIS